MVARKRMRNVSLQPDHELAIQYLRDEAGLEAASPVLQELIEREMHARFGREWRLKVREWADAHSSSVVEQVA